MASLAACRVRRQRALIVLVTGGTAIGSFIWLLIPHSQLRPAFAEATKTQLVIQARPPGAIMPAMLPSDDYAIGTSTEQAPYWYGSTSTKNLSGEGRHNAALTYKIAQNQFNLDTKQIGCLDNLWQRESGFNTHRRNPSSGAYGIPQALPANKMAYIGSDWRTNPVTQIRWGITYISSRYGSPCNAWNHSQLHNYY